MDSRQVALLSPQLRWFISAEFLGTIADKMQGFLIPLYLTALGADVVQVGLVFSVTSIVPLVLPVIGGWLSDSLGRLRIIAIGNLFGILGFVALILAPHWEWVILGLSLSGVAWSLQAPSSGAFIAEQTTETNRGKVYSVFENASQVANLIAYPIGGFLAEQFGFRFLLTVAGTLYVLVSVIYFWLAARAQSLRESNPGRLSLSALRGSFGVMLGMIVAGGVFTWIFILDHLNDIFTQISQPYEIIYLNGIGGLTIQQISWLPPIGAIIAILVIVPMGYLSDRFGEHVNLALAYLGLGVFKLLFVLSHSFPAFAFNALLHGTIQAMARPAYSSLISKVVPQERRGIAFGITTASRGLLSLPSPWLGGQLWDRFTPQTPFLVTAVACVGMSVLAWFKYRINSPVQNQPDIAESPRTDNTDGSQ